MANLERKYIINVRSEFKKVPRYHRAKKAVKSVRNFLQKHMKCEDVRLGKHLNLLLWSRGNRNPPHKFEVLATKVEEKDKIYVTAELANAPKEKPVKQKQSKKGGLASRLKSKIAAEEPQQEEKAQEQKQEFEALKKEEAEIMTHAEAPHPKKKTKDKSKEQMEHDREGAIVRDKKDVQHKKSKS